ncbi:MAG: Ig-like domain-containing protein, partial [Chloroflexota bacterium]
MKKIFGCLILLVLGIIAILLFVLVRSRAEIAAPPPPVQPAAQQQAQPSDPASAPTQPTIRIASPANGARVRVGQPFQVHVVANDPRGVAAIAFAVDGQLGSPAAASSPQTTFAAAIPITIQSKGIHAIAVQANGASGAKSQPVVVRVVAVQSLSDPTNPGDPPAPVPDVPTEPVSSGGNQVAPS